MRKGVYGHQLGRTNNQRAALFKSLISSLIEKGKIKTTLIKAKAIRAQTEKLITKAKRGTLADRREILRFLAKRSLVDRLVDGIAPLLKEQNSGYLKILHLGIRRGDCAEMALITFSQDILVLEKPVKAVEKTVNEEKLKPKIKEVKEPTIEK